MPSEVELWILYTCLFVKSFLNSPWTNITLGETRQAYAGMPEFQSSTILSTNDITFEKGVDIGQNVAVQL